MISRNANWLRRCAGLDVAQVLGSRAAVRLKRKGLDAHLLIRRIVSRRRRSDHNHTEVDDVGVLVRPNKLASDPESPSAAPAST